MKESLEYVYKEQKELSIYSGIGALLGWDQMTYMPSDGSSDRAEQTALISRLAHEKTTADALYDHVRKLNETITFAQLKEHDKLVVTRLKKDLEKTRKIPSAFIEKISKTTTLAYQAWEEARAKKNFYHFAPHLEKIIELEKEYCTYINLPGHPYNSLLDDYEEGMTVDILKKEFTYLRKNLIEILDKIKTSTLFQKQKPFQKTLSIENQKKLCNYFIKKMNLSKTKFRLDVSTHPFTTSIGNNDVRITTNFERKNPLFSFYSTIHEVGHALYELNLPQNEYKDTVISDSPSLGLHESQSRFWENMIARNKHFWVFFYPVFQKIVPKKFTTIALDQWYRIINQVQPSLIRVEADELTYCLHIILRFELELMLITDEIKVAEVPDIWDQKIQNYLGVRPHNDVEGALQDMHWSGGSFGYFPTYAIGSIYAAQLFQTLLKHHPDTLQNIEQGDFASIITWLQNNIHQYGRLMTADDIIKTCCGEGLNSQRYISYLKDKYYTLYNI
ncbi:MAG: carboxypeptidase M32 [Candidatus Thermoplasmatota archaeon]